MIALAWTTNMNPTTWCDQRQPFLIIEVKGWHREDVKDKHEAPAAGGRSILVGKTGKWLFHVNKDSQSLRNELDCITG